MNKLTTEYTEYTEEDKIIFYNISFNLRFQLIGARYQLFFVPFVFFVVTLFCFPFAPFAGFA